MSGNTERRIEDQLAGALAARPDMSARELIDALGLTGLQASKTKINASLYRATSRFEHDGGTPPRWRLVPPAMETSADPKAGAVPQLQPIADENGVRLPALYAWQAEALDAWRRADHSGVVEAVTGTGKTMVGMAAVAEARSHSARALVIVPSIELLSQWQLQLRRVLPTTRVGLLGGGHQARWRDADVIVAVVNSARAANLTDPGRYAVLVADECHRYGSEANALALDERFARRLGLSATYARSDEGNARFLDPYFGGTCFRMDYRRAIADEVTAHFKVALIGVPFAPGERAAYEEANKAAYEAQQWLINSGLVKEEPFGEFMKDVARLAEGEHGSATWKARSYLQNFTERRRILAESPAKRQHLARLVPVLEAADRSIIFTQTISGAEDAASVCHEHDLAAQPIHSQMAPEERRRTLGQFAPGRLQVITAPKVLDEGVDVPAADVAVIVSASRTQRQMIQRMGRVLRRKEDGRLARFAILYIEGSSEDPSRGAHGDFLDEITDSADSVSTFSSTSSAESIAAYLNDFESVGPPPSARMAGDPERAIKLISQHVDAAPSRPAPSPSTAAPVAIATPTPIAEPAAPRPSDPLPTTSEESPPSPRHKVPDLDSMPPRTMTQRRLKRLFKSSGLAKDRRRAALGPVLYRLGDLDDERLLAILRVTRVPEVVETLARGSNARLAGVGRRGSAAGELCNLYRQKHGLQWFHRFGGEVEDLLQRLLAEGRVPVSAMRFAIQRSHDPREIEHVARVNAQRFRDRDSKQAAARRRPTPAPKQPPPRPEASATPGRRPGISERLRPSLVRKRYCPSCGLLEEACRC